MNQAIRVLTIGLLATRLAGAAPAPATSSSAPTDAQIRTALRGRIAKLGPDAAIVFGWVDEKGPRILAEGKGPGGLPLSGSSVFEIGSASKAFTGILLADMVNKGEVSLNDPVAKLLPSSVHVPTRGDKQITLLDLATHTSGLPRLPDNLTPKDQNNPYADYTIDQLYSFLSSAKLSRDIGAQYEYSNLGMGLLGHALALKAGAPDYEALLKQRICTPLGMTDTSVTLSPDQRARLVPGHDAKGNPAPNWDLPTLAGAGGIRSTPDDMLRFVAANAGLTDTPLRPALDRSHEPRRDAGSPALRIGLAWHVFNTDPPVVWHNGQTGGYHSFVAVDPARKRGLVILVNSSTDIDDLGMKFITPKAPAAAPAPKHVAIKLDPAILDKYVGKYRLTKDAEFTIKREDDQMFVMLTGQSFLPMFPESQTRFFLKVVDAQISFKVNPKGQVLSLTLHQNGLNQEAKRE